MPAVVRGQPTRKTGAGKGGAKTPSGGRAAASRGRKPAAAYGGTGRFDGISPALATGVAAGVVVFATVALLATGGRGQAIAQGVAHGIDNGFGAAGFAVRHVVVQGASGLSEPDIRAAAQVGTGTPILGLDLSTLRGRIEKVGWVKSVHVVRMLPDTLVISVVERPRLAVWQNHGRLSLIDTDGQVITDTDAQHFVDLPLVVGEGANTAASAILPLVQARPSLMSRIWALVRVDNRRWDLRLKDQSLIQLPAEGEDGALMHLDQLERDQQVLSLGFSRIDLKTQDVRIRPREGIAGPLAAPLASPTPVAG
jgi:cell division protein FtsQ